ncbi:MAG: DegT/DnrJ/EryC1/StrS family aminotransferase [Thermodesulfovibrionales bacterium]|nr:DegT/DnrJ/EryC1/StrS family aminotransferase [Thermodesulfovibrionales bacterium]
MRPMIDLKKQYLDIKEEILATLNEILESCQYILGAKGIELEKKIAEYHNVKDAIGVASGTDALYLSLLANGIGNNDEIITTPFTFFATVEAIIYTGAKPVFVDIEPETFNIDTTKIEEAINEKTKAILPVHIFGHPADLTTIMKIANKFNLKVIEDCAQSFGASINGKKVGTFGDSGCFSFYPSKNLGAYGDGGMIITNNLEIAQKIRMLRNHGTTTSYRHEFVGYNSRLDEIQAGILLVKLKRIDEYNRKRRQKAMLYNSLLKGLVKTPLEKEGFIHVYHQYTILSESRDLIQRALREKGIPSVVYYPVPLHLQNALHSLGYKKDDFPVAEWLTSQVLSLPIYPELDDEEIVFIAKTIKECLKE